MVAGKEVPVEVGGVPGGRGKAFVYGPDTGFCGPGFGDSFFDGLELEAYSCPARQGDLTRVVELFVGLW